MILEINASSYIHHPVEKIVDREQAIKAAMSVTSQELDAVIIAARELIATKLSKAKGRPSWRVTIAERYS